MRNLLTFNISCFRGLFPENYFNDKSVPSLEKKFNKVMPIDAESRRLLDWMQEVSSSCSDSDSEEVMMNGSRTGDTIKGATFKSNGNTYITSNMMRSSACKMVRTLVQLMRTLDRMPEERTILMKLLYYEDVTPIYYEPPFFGVCSDQEANHPWLKNPLKMEIVNVNCEHFVLALKVKSILDPCQDENNDMEDDEEISLGVDSNLTTDSSDSDSKMSHSANDEDGYIVAPVDKARSHENNGIADHETTDPSDSDNEMSRSANDDDGYIVAPEDDAHDAEEDADQLTHVRDWISSRHIDNVELTDVLSRFPDISVALTEDDDANEGGQVAVRGAGEQDGGQNGNVGGQQGNGGGGQQGNGRGGQQGNGGGGQGNGGGGGGQDGHDHTRIMEDRCPHCDDLPHQVALHSHYTLPKGECYRLICLRCGYIWTRNVQIM
ncbi:meiosis-specific protein ASY1-like isoform X2 [Papaver somniferum]|nr:meiosis-specific protein ASY1-like isoform X2 [Papaver somniferum]